MNPGESTVHEVFDAISILQENHPGGVSSDHLSTLLRFHRATLSQSAYVLYLRGLVRREKRGKAWFYFKIADKYRSHCTEVNPAPKEAPSVPWKGDLHYWLQDLNTVISGLQMLKDSVPSLLAGLLDLSRDLERLAKVKEILGDFKNVARRNL